MRAAVIRTFDGPEAVEIADVEEQPVGPDSVLVEMAAAGVNPVDRAILTGAMQGAIPHHLPLTPGWDVAGTVVAVGPAIQGLAVGDRVAAYARKDHVRDGTFAERVSVPERAWAVVPDEVDLEVAACVPLAGMTADMLVEAAGVREGDTVLVHAAAGGVGTFAVQLARLRGATVIGTASEANHPYLEGLGATPVTYGEGLVDRVRQVAPGGVDAVIDLVGGEAVETTPQLGVDGVRLASVIDPEATQRLGGTYVFVRPDRQRLTRLLRLVADGALRVEISGRYPLEHAKDALLANASGHVRGKVVITRG